MAVKQNVNPVSSELVFKAMAEDNPKLAPNKRNGDGLCVYATDRTERMPLCGAVTMHNSPTGDMVLPSGKTF